jgi:ferredoxin
MPASTIHENHCGEYLESSCLNHSPLLALLREVGFLPLGLGGMEDYFELMSEREVFQVELLHDDKTRSIQVSRDEHIWDAAFKAGIVLPALCHQGYCLTCAGRLENGGEIDQNDSAQYYPEDRRAGFVLLCTGKPRSDLRINTHQAKAMREFRKSRNLPAPYSWNAG